MSTHPADGLLGPGTPSGGQRAPLLGPVPEGGRAGFPGTWHRRPVRGCRLPAARPLSPDTPTSDSAALGASLFARPCGRVGAGHGVRGGRTEETSLCPRPPRAPQVPRTVTSAALVHRPLSPTLSHPFPPSALMRLSPGRSPGADVVPRLGPASRYLPGVQREAPHLPAVAPAPRLPLPQRGPARPPRFSPASPCFRLSAVAQSSRGFCPHADDPGNDASGTPVLPGRHLPSSLPSPGHLRRPRPGRSASRCARHRRAFQAPPCRRL